MGCLTPIRIKAKQKVKGGNWDGVVKEDGHSIVPCGKCPECKKRRANSWIVRLQKEERIHNSALFVTLTYGDNVPLTKSGYMTLNKRDVQLFFKRLRKSTKVKTIKYYLCGEYGTDTWRPHYHAIMFDVPQNAIEKAWGLGHIHIGNVTGQSIAYTTKYICKDKRVPAHTKDDRIPEFALMSKNMGRNYLTPEMVQWHRDHAASYIVAEGGYQHPLPRYYRDFIFNEDERAILNYFKQLQFHEDFNRAIADVGSQKEYYRRQFDYIKQVLHKNKNSNKRNKI